MVPLPPEGVEAWKLLIQRDAWGKFARENINRDWKAAMRRAAEARIERLGLEGTLSASAVDTVRRAFAPVRCYSLRHSYATQLLMQGSDDLSLVQEALGHRDARTTRIYTTVKVNPRPYRRFAKPSRNEKANCRPQQHIRRLRDSSSCSRGNPAWHESDRPMK